MEKINKYDPFSDEVEYTFYTHPLNIKDRITNFEEILAKIVSKNKEDSSFSTTSCDHDDILDASG